VSWHLILVFLSALAAGMLLGCGLVLYLHSLRKRP
jgi:hypothetical protein